MFEQYPHYLFAFVPGVSTQNPDGSFSNPSPDEWVMVSICREETNGKGSTINVADGQAIIYASKVQLPLGSPRITEGTEIKICEGDTVESQLRISGKVLKYDAQQLHNRLWV